MKVTITLGRNESSSKKSNALSKIIRDLGSKATVSGDEIEVNEGYDERKVIDILTRENLDYSRSR